MLIVRRKVWLIYFYKLLRKYLKVHDTPSTIGDLLAELTQFALDISAFAADHGVSLNIGEQYFNLINEILANFSFRSDVI